MAAITICSDFGALEKVRSTAKLDRRYRDFPYTTCLHSRHSCTVSPAISVPTKIVHFTDMILINMISLYKSQGGAVLFSFSLVPTHHPLPADSADSLASLSFLCLIFSSLVPDKRLEPFTGSPSLYLPPGNKTRAEESASLSVFPKHTIPNIYSERPNHAFK